MTVGTQTVQLNVRMDRALRDAGNEVLAREGMSPSQFVRSMWSKLVRKGFVTDAEDVDQVPDVAGGSARRSAESFIKSVETITADTALSPLERAAQLREAFATYAYGAGPVPVIDSTRSAHEEAEDAIYEHYLIKEGLIEPWQTLEDYEG